MKLKNTTFVFENKDELVNFWNETIGKSQDSEIEYNHFFVIKSTWLLKLIKFILRIK